jgi:hypothetical protein
MVIVLAIGLKVCGFKPDRRRWIFKGDKNTWHYFLVRGVKTVGPIFERFYGMSKNPAECDRHTPPAKLTDFFAKFRY